MTRNLNGCFVATAVVLALSMVGGCGPQEKEDEPGHHHHHGSDTPHGGHLIKLEPADYLAEWTHDDKAGKLTVYIHRERQDDVPIAADLVKIKGEIKGDTPIPFEYPLIAVDPTDEATPKAFKFENSRPDPKLLANVNMGEAVGATLEFEVDGKSYKGAITHDHDH